MTGPDPGPGPAFGGELAARLTAYVREQRLPGAVAGIVHGDRLVWSEAIGYADLAARRPLTRDTLFPIASVTKTFTGTAVLRLRDGGLLRLDDPAVKYLPELRSVVSPFGPVEEITVRHLLAHESGLPAEPPGADWSRVTYQGDARRTLEHAADITTIHAPHARHTYSDLAYQLLGEIVARVTGTGYAEHLRVTVLDPLGLTDTSHEPLSAALAARAAIGYAERALSDDLDVAPSLEPVWSEGGLWSTLGDLARWLGFHIAAHRDPAADSAVLAPATARESHRPRYLADDDWTQAWALSWAAHRHDDLTWIGHAGSIPGHTSVICFDPDTGTGAVVLVNGTTHLTHLGLELAATARRALRAAAPAVTPPEPVPAAFRPLLGIYARPALNWLVRLEWRDGLLTVTSPQAPGWVQPLTPTDDPHVFRTSPDPSLGGAPVTVHRDAAGRVVSLTLMDSTFVRLAAVGTGVPAAEGGLRGG